MLFWSSSLALLFCTGAARPSSPKFSLHLGKTKNCKGCFGLEGPCILAQVEGWSKGSKNAKNGIRFCASFAHCNVCPRGYVSCTPNMENVITEVGVIQQRVIPTPCSKKREQVRQLKAKLAALRKARIEKLQQDKQNLVTQRAREKALAAIP